MENAGGACVHLNCSPGARFRTGVKPFKRVILLVLAIVLVLEIPRKIEDEDEKDDEDEPKTGIFHTSSSKRRPLQQFAFGGNFQDEHGSSGALSFVICGQMCQISRRTEF
jgi:hypothetical protein